MAIDAVIVLRTMATSEHDTVDTRRSPSRTAFWITLARAILATVLGLALILLPDKTRPMLINFMGVFWLVAGLMSVRWGASGERARPASVVVGVVGIVVGALVLGRFLLIEIPGQEAIVLLMGAIVVLMGLVHIFEGLRTGPEHERERSWTSALLGAFEIVLGITVLVWRDDFGPLFYAIVAAWAFISAIALLRDALRRRAAGAS
jgi:uncharacterized membrane protein HdeD (DUF308 family)